ncbi:MAG: DUF4430 domain-containing protein [Candidatus Paceibacterota bacterium]|nr:MAG: DUF4430 domain-containing protein [Candidatus Paceibacterota bacterium]
MQSFKILFIFIFGLIVGFVLSLTFLNLDLGDRVAQPAEGGLETSLMVDSGERIIVCRTTLEESKNTVFDLLEICAESENFEIDYKTYEGLGVLVNSIAGSPSTESRFWQYWVNNEYAEVSADNFNLEDEDVVLWKLTSY